MTASWEAVWGSPQVGTQQTVEILMILAAFWLPQMCPWKKLAGSMFFMPHRVFGLWKKTRKSSWCNLDVSLLSCSTNVAAMGCWNTVRKGMCGLSFFHQIQLCSLIMFSWTSEFPYVSTHTSKQWRTKCKVIPSNINTGVEGLNWTLYCMQLIWFWTLTESIRICGGLKPSNLGLLNASTQEMSSACWAPMFFAALLTVARKWKPKCPSTHDNTESELLWGRISFWHKKMEACLG